MPAIAATAGRGSRRPLALLAVVLFVVPARANAAWLGRLYQDEQASVPYFDLGVGFDRGSIPVASLEPGAFATIGDLLGKAPDPVLGVPVWDFSENGTGEMHARTQVPITSYETGHHGDCGFQHPDGVYDRDDNLSDPGDPTDLVNNVWIEADRKIYTWAGVIDEGSSEVRFCNDGGAEHPLVPSDFFPGQDGNGRYYQEPGAASRFLSGVVSCRQNLWVPVFGAALSDADPPEFRGVAEGQVLREGIVKTPSGHRLRCLVSKYVTEFVIYADSFLGCTGLPLQQQRQFRYSWSVPFVGGVAGINSESYVPGTDADGTLWTTASSTFFARGLLPPLAISASRTGPDRVEVAWTPGLLDAGFVDRYKVYWGTASGSYSGDSDSSPGRVAFNGARATVSGVADTETWYFTVTAVKNYAHRDPAHNPHAYESLLFPRQLPSDGVEAEAYPAEARVDPGSGGCAVTREVGDGSPPAAVHRLRVLRLAPPAPAFRLEWNAIADPCLSEYVVLSAGDPASRAGFTEEARAPLLPVPFLETGLLRAAYYLVAGLGTDGQPGPTGHCEENPPCP